MPPEKEMWLSQMHTHTHTHARTHTHAQVPKTVVPDYNQYVAPEKEMWLSKIQNNAKGNKCVCLVVYVWQQLDVMLSS